MKTIELTEAEYIRLMDAILWVLGPCTDEPNLSDHPHLAELAEWYNDLYAKTLPNSTNPKVAVQRLNQALCIYQSYCLVYNEVLLNRLLRVAAERCQQYLKICN